jgi:glycosyltransferase involved in cell wall biosynthesis
LRAVAAPVDSVALNALWLAPGDSGGPETYLRELTRALADEYPRLRLVVFTTTSGRAALAADGYGEIAELRALPVEEYRRVRRQVSEQLLLPIAARRAGAQLLHSLASTAPIRTFGLPSAITLHDVTFMHIETFGRVTTWGMTQVIGRAARHADALITGSAAARDDISATLGLAPGAFSVVPHGVTPDASAEPASERDLGSRLDLGEGQRVALCVAAVRPHKNQELLVRALPSLPEDIVVVLAGRREPYADQVERTARELGVADRLRLPGYLSDAELEALWRLAACAVFPTRAEGFGLPVLEAMARALPVACSDIPVLREVGGELPRYFDPADPAAAAQAIAAAAAPESAERGRAGVEHAGRFSWAESARGTMAAYERALSAARK